MLQITLIELILYRIRVTLTDRLIERDYAGLTPCEMILDSFLQFLFVPWYHVLCYGYMIEFLLVQASLLCIWGNNSDVVGCLDIQVS